MMWSEAKNDMLTTSRLCPSPAHFGLSQSVGEFQRGVTDTVKNSVAKGLALSTVSFASNLVLKNKTHRASADQQLWGSHTKVQAHFFF